MENRQNSTNINWYPGHMYKTKRQLEKDIKIVDIVIEILDARIPFASKNPDLDRLSKNKKRLILLNKSDLADDKITSKWLNYFQKNGISVLTINANTGNNVDKIIPKIEEILEDEIKSYEQKGRVGRKIKAMIVGIPNVGKSSLINKLIKKTVASVENKPGHTKSNQWYRLNQRIELLDTPGILWPKFEDDTGIMLAMTGSIKENILDRLEIAYDIVLFMLNNYKENIMNRYKVNQNELDEIFSNDELLENEKIYEVMKLIGRKRGTIISGNRVDDEKISKIIIDEFKSGKLGKVSLQCPK